MNSNTENLVVKICQCGKPLIAVYDENGDRLGVRHIDQEAEDHHNDFCFQLYGNENINRN